MERQTIQWTKEEGQRTNTDLQNITHKIKDRVTRTPLNTGGELRCSGRVVVPAPLDMRQRKQFMLFKPQYIESGDWNGL
jgi:hypothetical protein